MRGKQENQCELRKAQPMIVDFHGRLPFCKQMGDAEHAGHFQKPQNLHSLDNAELFGCSADTPTRVLQLICKTPSNCKRKTL